MPTYACTLTLSLSLRLSLSLSLSLSHTHTHTHTQSVDVYRAASIRNIFVYWYICNMYMDALSLSHTHTHTRTRTLAYTRKRSAVLIHSRAPRFRASLGPSTSPPHKRLHGPLLLRALLLVGP